jgi:RND family efflux transporter MFP subunit
LIGSLLLAAGCGQPTSPADSSPTGERVPTVAVVQPEQKSLRRVIELPAFVEAYEETLLIARIAGYVQKVHADIGDRVKGPRVDEQGKQLEPGQVLAELWVPEMKEELRQKQALVAVAEAEVEQDAAALEAAEANVVTARAMVREAEAARTRAQANFERWESEYQRVQKLVASKVIDEQTRDETRNQFKAAEASRAEVEARVHSAQAAARESEARRNKTRADLVAAKAHVEVACAEEGRTAALLRYSKLRAPFDGVVVKRNIHTGHYLQPAGGSGLHPVLVVARMDTVRVLVDVPEAEARYVREGVPATVRFPVIKDREFTGKVTRSSWSLDPRARTLRAEIDLPNPQGLLRPGMYAYPTLCAELPAVFTLPASAVVQAEPPYCCQVNGDRVSRLPVRIGVRDGQVVQVLKKQVRSADGQTTWEDLTGQEAIAVTSPATLSDGQAVSVERKP